MTSRSGDRPASFFFSHRFQVRPCLLEVRIVFIVVASWRAHSRPCHPPATIERAQSSGYENSNGAPSAAFRSANLLPAPKPEGGHPDFAKSRGGSHGTRPQQRGFYRSRNSRRKDELFGDAADRVAVRRPAPLIPGARRRQIDRQFGNLVVSGRGGRTMMPSVSPRLTAETAVVAEPVQAAVGLAVPFDHPHGDIAGPAQRRGKFLHQAIRCHSRNRARPA